MAQTRIIRTDAELECPHVDRELRARGHDLVLLPEGISEQALIEEARDAALILMCYTPVSERVIRAAGKLKGIVKYGVGIDAIDIDAARGRGIPVANVPEYAEETVAEGAFCLLMALAKKLLPIHTAVQRGGWVWPQAHWLGADLAGKTLGLVGTGRIGRSMARMAAGFRMRVLGYDPHVEAAVMKAHGIEKATALKSMLDQCDVVSIHAVLNKDTLHLLGPEELSCLRPGAFLINVSRGAIVDEQALLEVLRAGRIAGAGLDVYASEPLMREGHLLSELYGLDNVVLFPHLTFYTHEAMDRLEAETLERCLEILEGRPLLIKSMDPRLRAQTHGIRFV